MKNLIKRDDAIVAISNLLLSFYFNKMHIPKEKVHLIVNGIDLSYYKKSDNIRPEKNHKLLISAFSKIAMEFKEAHLLIVGLDCMNYEIHQFAKQTDAAERIHFLGQRKDVAAILNILDIFCLTSVNEGLPLTVLEAMASGVPVIGSDVMGINEVITDNVNGLLFPNNDEVSLVETIKKLLLDDKLSSRIIKEGRLYVLKKHNLEDKLKEYDFLFKMLHYG